MSRLLAAHDVVLLEQSSFWRSRGDNGLLITQYLTDMAPAHRERALAWLRANAEQLQAQHRADVVRMSRQGRIDLHDLGDRLNYIDALDAAIWIEERPLVRRLAQLTDRRPALKPRGLLRRLVRR